MSENFEKDPMEEQKVEEELSLEIIEMVMEKVRDIDEKGTAYTGIARSGIEPTFGSQLPPEISDKESRAQAMKSVLEQGLLSVSGDKKSSIYFNISGRSKNVYEQGVSDFPVTEKDKPQVYYGRFSSGRVNMIFDMSFLQEADLDFYLQHSQKQRTHSVVVPELKSDQYMVTPSPEDSKIVIDAIKNGKETESYAPGTGFVTSSDIDPKYFLGIVVPAIMRIATEQEKEQHNNISYMVDNSKDAEIEKGEYVKMAKNIMFDVFKEKSDRLIPIYDAEGNLLWPKEMGYQEVKKFIEEGNKSKEVKDK